MMDCPCANFSIAGFRCNGACCAHAILAGVTTKKMNATNMRHDRGTITFVVTCNHRSLRLTLSRWPSVRHTLFARFLALNTGRMGISIMLLRLADNIHFDSFE